MKPYWFSTQRMTVMILADKDDIIRSTPPIIAKFVGQRVDNLRRWLIKQPGYVEHIY